MELINSKFSVFVTIKVEIKNNWVGLNRSAQLFFQGNAKVWKKEIK